MSSSSPSIERHSNPVTLIAAFLFLGCLAHALWAFSIGWNNTINDHHSFRQSQTAITAYYLKEKPFKLAYETPVLGKPWSVPLEMPFYQLAAARLSSAGNVPLDQAGRGVAATCYMLILIPVFFLLREFRVSCPHALLVLCILLVSPFYLFWSRAFLIESSVLLLCFCYLTCVISGINRKSRLLLALAVLFGIVAGLAKVTTWLPFLLIGSLWAVRDWIRWPLPKISGDDLRNRLPVLMTLSGIPFLSALAWVKYMDFHKKLNPLALNSPAFSTSWNFGTLEQKLSPAVWTQILSRAYTLFGLPLQGWLILAASVTAVMVTKKRRGEVCVMLVLYLIYPIIFTNLHFIHDYYMYANGLFLVALVGFALIALLETDTVRSRVCGWLLLAFVLFSGVSGYTALYKPIQEMPNPEILQVTDYLQKNTPENSVLIILGADWSPLVPYYSKRRSLMIPDWTNLTDDQVNQALRNLKGEKIGALLVCGPSRYPAEKLLQQAKAAGLDFPIMQCGQLPLR
jgi:hypothetical protein